jgi:hypothetical protein
LPLPARSSSLGMPDAQEIRDIAERGSKDDLLRLMKDDWYPKHEMLQMKYSKVKRYYFDREAQITSLQNDIKNLKEAEGPANLEHVALSVEGAAAVHPSVKQLLTDMQRVRFELQTAQTRADEAERAKMQMQQDISQLGVLQKENDWYRMQLLYWKEIGGGSDRGSMTSTGSSGYSTGSSQTTLAMR